MTYKRRQKDILCFYSLQTQDVSETSFRRIHTKDVRNTSCFFLSQQTQDIFEISFRHPYRTKDAKKTFVTLVFLLPVVKQKLFLLSKYN